VHEPHAPAGQGKPLEWMLPTTLPVGNREDAGRILDYYRLPDASRTGKSGCRAEFLNPESAERLERAITVKAVMAWRLFAMAMMGRETPELPSEVLFSDLEIRIMEPVDRTASAPVRQSGQCNAS